MNFLEKYEEAKEEEQQGEEQIEDLNVVIQEFDDRILMLNDCKFCNRSV